MLINWLLISERLTKQIDRPKKKILVIEAFILSLSMNNEHDYLDLKIRLNWSIEKRVKLKGCWFVSELIMLIGFKCH